MRPISASLLILVLFAVSCHSRVAVKADDCCAGKHAAATVEADGLAGSSVYQLGGDWTDQNGRRLELRDLKGRPRLIAMVYSHCGYTCPRLISDMKTIRNALPAGVRAEVGCVLVTLDPDRDTPARLREFARQKQLDSHWELLRGSDAQIRELSMVLNVQYNDLGNGVISHSANINMLDPDGRIVQSLQGLGASGSLH